MQYNCSDEDILNVFENIFKINKLTFNNLNKIHNIDFLAIIRQLYDTKLVYNKYFDLDETRLLGKEIETERQRIIQKMILAKQAGAPAMPPSPKVQHLWHCDDLGEE